MKPLPAVTDERNHKGCPDWRGDTLQGARGRPHPGRRGGFGHHLARPSRRIGCPRHCRLKEKTLWLSGRQREQSGGLAGSPEEAGERGRTKDILPGRDFSSVVMLPSIDSLEVHCRPVPLKHGERSPHSMRTASNVPSERRGEMEPEKQSSLHQLQQ